MRKAVELVIRYFFEVEGQARLQIGVTPNNKTSIEFARKLGFQSEGTLRSFFKLRSVRKDVEIFSILKDEWK